MAGYPYTGGIYGGYSDPANNKKATFIGPKADEALRRLPATYRDNSDTGASTISDAGASSNPLAKTPGGYPNIGLSTPRTTAREMPLNIPFQGADSPAGTASTARQGLALNVAPSPSHTPVRMNTLAGGPTSFSGNENARPQSLAATGLASPSPATQKFRTTLAGGINYTGDNQGNRTFSMGIPGQDGYGSVSVRPGSATGQAARNSLAANVPQAGQQTRQVGGLTVTGNTDAVNRLADPVGTYDRNSPEYNQVQAQNYQKANPFSQNNPYDDRFSYRPPQGSDSPLIAPPPIAHGGGGWQSQADADKANAAAYGDYVRALSTLQSSAAQERGANYRAGLQQQGVNDRNAIDREGNVIARQRLGGELALNDARIASEGINQQKGQMDVDQARKMQALSDQYLAEQDPAKQKALGNQLLTMQGKASKDWQITTREEPVDPANPMLGTTKRPYAVNLNDPNQVIELGGQGGGGQRTDAPAAALEYLKKNPGQAQYFKQKYGYLPGES